MLLGSSVFEQQSRRVAQIQHHDRIGHGCRRNIHTQLSDYRWRIGADFFLGFIQRKDSIRSRFLRPRVISAFMTIGQSPFVAAQLLFV